MNRANLLPAKSLIASTWLLLALGMGACGGSSKGGSGGGLTLSPSALAFAAAQGSSAPPSQSLHVSITSSEAAYVGAGFVDSAPSWVRTGSLTGAGSSWVLPVEIIDTSLPPGGYTATLRVGIARADQSIIATRDAVITYTVLTPLTASPAWLSFRHVVGGPTPPAQDISVGGAGTAWTSSADQAWIQPGSASGTAPSTIHVAVDPTGLAPGAYAGTISISRAGGGGDARAVGVQLTVEAPALRASASSLSFSGVNGADLGSLDVEVGLTNGAPATWTAAPSASWIVLDKTSGTTPEPIAVRADPSQGPLASGAYTGTITFSASFGGEVLTAVVGVDMALTRPTLSVSPSVLVLGGPTGRDLGGQEVQLGLDTGGQAHPWTASPSQGWMLLDASSGQVSGSPSAIAVGIDRTGMVGGTYAGSLGFSATVNGDLVTASIPVTLNLDAHRLLASYTGVAFASMPGLASTTRTLRLRDNLGLATPWTASSSQAWLSATSSGTAPGDLVLGADPAGLAADTVHYATVTVSSTDPSVAGTEIIQVGFWVGSTAPPASTALNIEYSSLAVDPIRPYAYVHQGGTDITVYNVHTTQIVTTIPAVAAGLGKMTVAMDGSTLFAVDDTNFQIVPMDLSSRTKGTPWGVGSPVPAYLAYSRTNGRGLIVVGNACIYDAGTGASYGFAAGGSPGSYWNWPVSASLAGNVYSHDAMVHTLDYTSAGGGTVLRGPTQYPNVTMWNSQDYAFDNPGTRMYMAVGAPYDFYVVDTTTSSTSLPLVQTLPGDAYPNNVEVARDGRIFAGIAGYTTKFGPRENAWIFAPGGAKLASFLVSSSGPLDRQLRVSGDGLRMVTIAAGSYPSVLLTFHTVAP